MKFFSSKHLALNSDPSLNRLQFLKKAGNLALSASALAFLASCVGNNSQTNEDDGNQTNPNDPGNPVGPNPGQSALNPALLELNFMNRFPIPMLSAIGNNIVVTNHNQSWQQSILNNALLSAAQKFNMLDKIDYLPNVYNLIRSYDQYQGTPLGNYYESHFVAAFQSLLTDYRPNSLLVIEERTSVGIQGTLVSTGRSIAFVKSYFDSLLYRIQLGFANTADISGLSMPSWINLEDQQ